MIIHFPQYYRAWAACGVDNISDEDILQAVKISKEKIIEREKKPDSFAPSVAELHDMLATTPFDGIRSKLKDLVIKYQREEIKCLENRLKKIKEVITTTFEDVRNV